ncbi:type II toxin-antitoxin system RelE/ParE family toxin [Chroococcidiopsis sp. FACHB-1243]|uniref:type II toxin-antitoxin system RelE/ParE family toxin n=1 Tax=Chroococcidiopsis sp. [FACHB-1243] TaxID=2692781 RepID=UPI00177BCDFD|nr:type II toxin-antitoxin system RelE/ParE family toxin [Chroococcidiopsis sp. [FACHB-1243]]MBD2308103.1 type II toxin-antitoxin system RelE/ParE family toxin [Chroococcidiopsis sp. [FACHB-1243]]
MSQYIISQPASRDLQDILNYFAVENVNASERFLQSFNKKCQQLVSFPNMGQQYDNLRLGLRGLPLDGYIILYQVGKDRIEIVRVVSGKRNLETLFANPEEE